MSTPFYDLASLVVVPSGYKASKVYAQKPQTTDGQLAFTRSTTATRVNSAGLIEASAVNLPRLDYLNSSCPRLLLEPQRTNLVTYSEQLDNAAWSKEDILSVTANAVVSPDGSTNADLVIPNTTSADHSIYQTSGIGSAQTFSTFAKAGGYNFIFLGANNAVAANGVFFNLSNGTISQNTSSFTATITSYGNGWYRCTISIASWPSGYAIICTSATGTSFVHAGNGTSGVYVWGAQLEAGAYATSYIPTLGASVTRGADAASKTGISSLIGQTEGTLFVDFTLNGLADYGTPISVNDGSTTNYIWLTIFANGTLRAELYNGAAQASISYSGAVAGGRYKMAFGYKANDFAFYVNGALVGTDSTGTTFSGTTLSRVDTNLTNSALYSTASESINQALLFTTRLTNAQLAELTTI